MAERRYDIVVIGGGHAGIEAAAASARLGMRTLLVTMRLDEVGRMSCNPSIGGLGKGHLVREIDALGGLMARATDATGLQFRMLNMAKGPAVRAPRAQADKVSYPKWMRNALESEFPTLELAEGEVTGITLDSRGVVKAVIIGKNETVACRAVIVTAGTHLNGLIHVGMDAKPGGRWGDPPSTKLAECLKSFGLKWMRLKTGTPARIARDSIDWDSLEEQPGDTPPPPFSYLTEKINREQIACAITYTNQKTHEIINTALDRSPLYTGKIVGLGPRYCPSIETKLERFPDRERHQIFLEPESLSNNVVYVNGVSTSLPPDTQDAFLHSIRGLEQCKILRMGYGIEYDAFAPEQLRPTLECPTIPGLYLAGQLNGTTGYEEAAGLGLIAGANAALKLLEREPLTFRRDEAYLGVMIDDLLTKGAPEPYRLFTSRAEFRLLLRQDNADLRLTEKGRDTGLVDDARWKRFCDFRNAVGTEQDRLAKVKLKPADLDVADLAVLEECEITAPKEALSLEQFMARPHVDYALLERLGFEAPGGERVREQCEIQARYAGYIERQEKQVERQRGVESHALPDDLDYNAVPSLRKEAAGILSGRRPSTLGQAGRLSGVNPADVTAIMIYLKGRGKY